MKISYKWLKEYINTDLFPNEISSLLTDCGLEVEAIEDFETVKGSLSGFVIGCVLTKQKHPDADRLSLTTVDIGNGDPLHIVCGAPNVEAGQKVIVATIGTTIYSPKGEFIISKSKIRGCISEGMICAEDELGLGTSHEGIMVLDSSAAIGRPASEYFNLYSDKIFEIGLTPNRVDAASHYGVARDLAAVINCRNRSSLRAFLPSVEAYKKDNDDLPFEVKVESAEACTRYSGVTIKGVSVTESPDWLKNRLLSIGLRPINNIVDITNYILHELAQPLHAFDADKIEGKKVIVKKLHEGTKFVTLDGVERALSSGDLMICDTQGGMCIAGVYGGIHSGVTEDTKNIFLESACFESVHIRKTSKLHGLKTDASFRFERGTDPNITVYALKRAALLIKELAGGTISSDIIDVYPEPIPYYRVEVLLSNITRLIGKEIASEDIRNILESLEIKVVSEDQKSMLLEVPPYRVDVRREADVIEEILRIYGYNNIDLPGSMHTSLSSAPVPDKEKLQNIISDYLSSNGFNEILNNSLTNPEYTEQLKDFSSAENVVLLNPLSNELAVMRQSLLFGALESVAYNQNRKNSNLKLFEFGKTYKYDTTGKSTTGLKNYIENYALSVLITGSLGPESWNTSKQQQAGFFILKAYVNNILNRIGIKTEQLRQEKTSNDVFSEAMVYSDRNQNIATFGCLRKKVLKLFDIKHDVYFADINWGVIVDKTLENIIVYKDLSKFPPVRRDLALLIDRKVTYAEIENAVKETNIILIKEVNLFDIYQGENIGMDKKSYAISVIIQDEEKTLTDAEIESVMAKIVESLNVKLNASLR